MTATRSARKYPCALCGKEQHADQMIYSRFTNNRYCIDHRACDRRAARNKASNGGASA